MIHNPGDIIYGKILKHNLNIDPKDVYISITFYTIEPMSAGSVTVEIDDFNGPTYTEKFLNYKCLNRVIDNIGEKLVNDIKISNENKFKNLGA